ncbi:TetR/AcrR family transcriptional regulator [Pseudomonas sp. KCJK9044]|uniref:TetR/AcrR family transcriptional regulator n=1 Tax=Pseudomonas sp. KCJK9044 TaxID=3344562 RepID=UPI003906C208
MTSERIREVASELMCEMGYRGMSMRALATAVGVQAGSLYNFVESKQLLLFELINQHEHNLLNVLRDSALAQADSAVQMHSLLWEKLAEYSTQGGRAARVAKAEIQHLDTEQAEAIAEVRLLQRQELLRLIVKTAGDDIGLSPEGLENLCDELHALLICHLNLEAEPHVDPTQMIRRQLRILSTRLLLSRD